MHGGYFILFLFELSELNGSPLCIMWSKDKNCGSLQTSLGRPHIPVMTLNLFHLYLPLRTLCPLPFDYRNPTISTKPSLASLFHIDLTPTSLNCFHHPRSRQQHLEVASVLVCDLCFTWIPLISVSISQTSWMQNQILSFLSASNRDDWLKDEWIDRSINGA